MKINVINEHPKVQPKIKGKSLIVCSGETINIPARMNYAINTSVYFPDLPQGVDLIVHPEKGFFYKWGVPKNQLQHINIRPNEPTLVAEGQYIGRMTPILKPNASFWTKIKFCFTEIQFNIINKNQ